MIYSNNSNFTFQTKEPHYLLHLKSPEPIGVILLCDKEDEKVLLKYNFNILLIRLCCMIAILTKGINMYYFIDQILFLMFSLIMF